MKTILSIATYLIVTHALPCLGTDAMWSWPVWVLAGFTTLILLFQPAANTREAREHRATDRGTIWLILVCSTCGLMVSVWEWAWWRGAPERLDYWNVSGLGMLAVGLWTRIAAVRTLGRHFAAAVQIKPGQRLVTSGLYQYIRHPSYTGAWMMMVGASLMLHSRLGLVWMGPVMLVVYLRRIDVEERALLAAFGDEYRHYRARTGRLLPFPKM